jgi:hypothetical protein
MVIKVGSKPPARERARSFEGVLMCRNLSGCECVLVVDDKVPCRGAWPSGMAYALHDDVYE